MHAVIRSRNVNVDYLDPKRLDLPRKSWLTNHTPNHAPRLVPFQNASVIDMVVNLLLFIPFGTLLVLLIPDLGYARVSYSILTIGIISSAFELWQLFVPARTASVTDVILNTMGGAIGAFLFRFWQHRHLSRACLGLAPTRVPLLPRRRQTKTCAR